MTFGNMRLEGAVDIQVVQALRQEAFRAFGADVVANMLEIPHDGNFAGADPDYLLVLTEIMHILVRLCGDQRAAVLWLFDSSTYRTIAGNDPYYCLEQGSFWAMSVMKEWLEVIEKFGSPQFRKDVFQSPSVCTERRP